MIFYNWGNAVAFIEMAQPRLDAGKATLLAKDAQGRPVHLPWRGVAQSPTDGWWTRLAIVPQEIGGMQMHEVVHIQFPDKCLSDPDTKHVQTSIAFMQEDAPCPAIRPAAS